MVIGLNESEIESRFSAAVNIAERASKMALDYFNKRDSLVIEMKMSTQDLVSIADRAVENFIKEMIDVSFPFDGFLGEESGYSKTDNDILWVVDPIDGTSAFLSGIPNWCVSIAVLYKGKPVVGVVIAPLLNECYKAMQGSGAYLNDKIITVNEALLITNGLTGLGINHHVSTDKAIFMVKKILDNKGNFFRNASGALMTVYVASGKLCGYIEPHIHLWDCAAGLCIVEEAGGRYLPLPPLEHTVCSGFPVLFSNSANYGILYDALALSD